MRQLTRALFGALLVFISQIVWAHPDIVIQIEGLTEQLDKAPDNVELLLKRGDLYRRHQDYDAAKADFDRVLVISPGEPLLDFYRGRLQQETGYPERADILLQRYLEQFPDHAKAWKLHAEVKLSLSDPVLAGDFFQQAIELSDSPSPELYRLLIMSQIAAGESREAEAMSSADDALNAYGFDVSILGLGVDMALASGQVGRAKDLISQLPAGLMKLDQWNQRNVTLVCLEEGTFAACRTLAQERLREQSETFMESFQP